MEEYRFIEIDVKKMNQVIKHRIWKELGIMVDDEFLEMVFDARDEYFDEMIREQWDEEEAED